MGYTVNEINLLKSTFNDIIEYKDIISEVLYERFFQNSLYYRIELADINRLNQYIEKIDHAIDLLYRYSDSMSYQAASMEYDLPPTYLEDLRDYAKTINATINRLKESFKQSSRWA